MNIDSQQKIIYLDKFYLELTMKEFHACLRDHYHQNRHSQVPVPFEFDGNGNLVFIKKGWTMMVSKEDY